MSAHIALRMLLALSQPVNCTFWPRRMLDFSHPVNCINIDRGHATLLSDPTVHSLFCVMGLIKSFIYLLFHSIH